MGKEKIQRKFSSGSPEAEGIEDGIGRFNKYMGPEAFANLIDAEDGKIKVRLSGPFCRTCGVYDYFDDLKTELEKTLEKPLTIACVDGDDGDSYVITYVIGDGDANHEAKIE